MDIVFFRLRPSAKIWSIIALLVFIQPVFTSEIVENASYTGEKTTIKYSLWGGSDEIATAKQSCEQFVTENPDIRLEVSVYPWGQYWAKLQIQAASGLAPDVISLYSQEMGLWIDRGTLLALDDLIENSGVDLSQYFDAAVETCRWKNKIFCMPTGITCRTIVYSTDRLEESGIPRSKWPKSNKPMEWDEFNALVKKLTLRNPDGTFSQYGMTAGHDWTYSMLRMFGGSFVDRQVDPTRQTIIGNEDLAKGIIEVFKSQYGDKTTLGFIPLTAGAVRNLDTLIMSKKFVMGMTGPWALGMLKDANIRFGLTPLPRGPNPSHLIYVGGLGIYSDSKEPEAAWRFIKFKASKESQIQSAKMVRGIPAMKEATEALINNDLGIPGCEAFIYDLDIATPKATSGNRYVLDAINKWMARIETDLDREYDKRIHRLANKKGTISDDDYAAFVNEMNLLIEKTVHEKIPGLDKDLAEAFERGKIPEMNLAIKVILPALMMAAVLGLIIFYIIWFRKNSEGRKPLGGKENNIVGYMFISPWLIGFLVFSLLPIIASIVLSFTQWNMTSSPIWVGLRNYIHLPTDRYFLMGLVKTFKYASIAIPISLFGGLFTAGLLTCNIRGSAAFKSIFYFPSLFTGAAVAVLWVNMFNKEYGVINHLLSLMDMSPVNWMGEAHAFKTVMMMNFFWIGGAMIIYYAGMKQIPASLYEAADIDGAGPVRKFVYITIPMLSPVILFMVIMSTIGAFQVFTPALFFASSSSEIGGPGDALRFYSVNIYNEAFNYLRMGKACAFAIVLFFIIFLITMIQLKLSKRFVHTEAA